MRLVRLCLILLKQCKERGRSLWMGIPWHLQIKQLKQTKLSSKGNFSRIEEDCKPMETTPTGTGLMGTILIEMAQGITGTIIIPVVGMLIRCLSGLSNSKLTHTTITPVPMQQIAWNIPMKLKRSWKSWNTSHNTSLMTHKMPMKG